MASVHRQERSGAPSGAGILLDVNQVGGLLGCSARHVYRMADLGKMPGPVRIGALVRWRRPDLLEWINAGCPAVRSVRGAT
jgi:excisionase family DNA binding protein